MVSSSENWLIPAIFVALMLVVYSIESLAIGLVINLVLRTPLHFLLGSSLGIGIGAFLLTTLAIVFWPGSFVTFNGEPRSTSAWLAHNQGRISAISVFVTICVWQIFRRYRAEKFSNE